jgi:glycosyltransferase involved in cell wall biosynthesis
MSLRILLTADPIGGVWSFAVELAEAIQSQDVEILLAAMGASLAPGQRRQVARLSRVELHESRRRLEWMWPDPWDDVARAGEWLLGLEAEFGPHVVHLNQYSFAALPWRVPTILTAHSCVLSWSLAVHGVVPASQWDEYARAVRRGVQEATIVVAPSRWMLAQVLTHYGEPRRSAVIPNGRRAGEFVSRAKEPIILAAGRAWDPAKNLTALARVAPELSWPVYVAGDTTAPDGAVLELPDVRCLGRVDPVEMARWFGRAEVYAFPARYEPFGLSVLEAALAGCTLVLGDIPSLRENWTGCARFVPPGDHAQLRDTLRDTIADPALRQRLREHAQTRSRELSSDRMAAAYLALYSELAGASARRSEEETRTCMS